MNKHNCECCGGTYATGKSYGDYWVVSGFSEQETKGLCEFCNPSNVTWYESRMKCHKKIKKLSFFKRILSFFKLFKC